MKSERNGERLERLNYSLINQMYRHVHRVLVAGGAEDIDIGSILSFDSTEDRIIVHCSDETVIVDRQTEKVLSRNPKTIH